MALLKLVVHYPEAGHNGKTIALISEDYLSDLSNEGMTLQQFKDTVDHVRKSCGFFPKVKDMIESWRYISAHPPRRNSSLQIADTSSEHDLTPEEVELSEKLRRIALKAVAGKLSPGEAVKLQEDLLAAQKKFSGRLRVVGE